MTATVELRAVSKTFAGRHRNSVARPVLRDVNLRVSAGEFVSVIGPSGCGKSTLLNVLAGFARPDGGSVLVDGVPVRGPGADRGVLFQTPNLFPWLTVWKNVLYGAKARGSMTASVRAEAQELLASVGLTDARDAYPHELSGGMAHRAAFARALLSRPTLLLMDEPFSALDAITRTSMQDFLRELCRRNRLTVVFVTHDIEEATLLSDRVVVMSPGPGHVVDEIAVELPAARAVDAVDTLEFLNIKRKLRAALRSTGVGGDS